MTMNLKHWRLLVAVFDGGNLSRAAEQVGMTQSGASQAIAQIEDALGVQLFVRERRQLSNTALGEQIADHARALSSHLEAIRALADASRGLNRGRIRLASFPSVISKLLPPIMRRFQQRHPGVDIVLLEGTDIEVEEWLRTDTIDLGVVLNPTSDRLSVPLGQDVWTAVLPDEHPLGHRASALGVSLTELAAEPFILATGGCHVNAQSLMSNVGLQLSDIRATIHDWASACVMVREGLGAAIVPESTLPEDRRGMRIVPLYPSIFRVFGLVSSQMGRSSLAAQTFLRELSVNATASSSR